MQSPLHPDTSMQLREIEPGLSVYECPKSGGLWIPLQAYLAWKETQPQTTALPTDATQSPATVPAEESKQRTVICPESGRLLLRYRAGHGLPFHIERSPATGGVWLDKGEWEALKSKDLHVALHLICTSAYQKQIRTNEYVQTLTDTFRDRIGPEDFSKVAEFTEWLKTHPKRRDICCYLLDNVDQKTESESTPPGSS